QGAATGRRLRGRPRARAAPQGREEVLMSRAYRSPIDWRDPAVPTAESMADWIKEHLGFDLLPSQRYWLNATVIDRAEAPRKRKGLTGKAYRIARGRYARRRRLGTLPKIYRDIQIPNARINLKEI